MGSGGRPFSLLPGQGLGPFRLGQCLADALDIVRQQSSTFRSCEVKYAKGKGLPRPDVALAFPELGFHLLFDGTQQRLRLIEVHDATRLLLSYGGRLLGGGPSPPRFGRVCEELGPTFPGEAARGLYPLQYPGVVFLFPLDPHTAAAAAAAGQPARASMSSSIAGVEFPVPLSTPAARILIHHGSAACLGAARAAAPPPLPAGAAYFEPVEALAGQGLLLSGSGACLRLGDSPQDVVSELGEPSSMHIKPGRQGPAGLAAPPQPGTAGSAPGPPDYFYCFAERGIDLLFCGSSHRLKKLVLHANAPGHPDFGLYRKCNFRVHPAGSWSLPGSGGDGMSIAGGGMAWEAGNGGSPLSPSSGSEGAGSMKTAASHASLPGEDAAGAVAGLLHHHHHQQQHQQQQQQHWGTAARQASSAAAEAAAAEHAGIYGEAGDGGQLQAGATAALGRPPRPPTTLPVPTQPPASGSKSGASKKKKKKERQRAAAAAKLLGAGGGSGDESAADTDTSFADSAPSSLASSPGMTSFLSNIAATGGASSSRLAGPSGGVAHGAAAEAPAPPSGYSSDGGSHPSDFLAGKERRMECGSAYDGWSEADDLALLVGGDEPAAPTAPTAAVPADSAAEQQALRCSIAVQTAPVDEAELALDGLGDLPGYRSSSAAAAAGAGAGSSPDSFVLAESPALFDEAVAAAEYEAVPHLRSCSTQTQPYHVPAGAARRPCSAASGSVRLRRPPAGAASAACVGMDGSLADIRAAFGAAAKPALHTRLGGRHPFGPTHLYAFRGAVFEVTRSGAIATVTLFEA